MSRIATTPAFLLSLPRSGSTLLQRLLATHPDIATASEPWLLPPHLFAVREGGVFATYNHASAQRGIHEFLAAIPDGTALYRRELATFLIALYTHAAGGKPVFLDKTPRNSLVADELLDLFPASPVLLLWRNPIAVVSSISATWGNGHWIVPRYVTDLVTGFRKMLELLEREDDRVLSLSYEQLIADPAHTLAMICRHLDVQPVEGLEASLTDVKLNGSMGDATGTRAYTMVSSEPLEKWRRAGWSPVRKAWVKRWLRSLDASAMARAGYDLEALCYTLDRLPTDWATAVPDQIDVLRTTLPSYLEPAIWREKLRALRGRERVVAHR